MSEYESGERVVHDKYGIGTVREHPDAPGKSYPDDPRNDTHVYFDDTKETTIVRVRDSQLRPAINE